MSAPPLIALGTRETRSVCQKPWLGSVVAGRYLENHIFAFAATCVVCQRRWCYFALWFTPVRMGRDPLASCRNKRFHEIRLDMSPNAFIHQSLVRLPLSAGTLSRALGLHKMVPQDTNSTRPFVLSYQYQCPINCQSRCGYMAL